jgi:hypothetical protein
MKTPVSCEGCHRRYEVDGRFAGRTVKCAYCGQLMRIPVAEPIAPPRIAHAEYDLGDPLELEAMSFQAAPARQTDEKDQGRQQVRKVRRKRSKGGKSARPDIQDIFSRPGLLIGLAVIAVIVVLLAAFVPVVRVPIGIALALPGVLLCLYGYASGAYIAFTEDDLHGWLYLLFPFYAAYYLVSRWDDMSSRLVMVVLGLVLAGVGGRMLEGEVARAIAAKSEAAAKG